ELADNEDAARRSPLRLFENGAVLGPPHAAHALIRSGGGGAFSHWKSTLYFSTSDGSDPNVNGRAYEIVIPGTSDPGGPKPVNGAADGPAPAAALDTARIAADASDLEARLQAARRLFEHRQWTEVLPVLKDLSPLLPQVADLRPMLARTHLELGQLHE